MSATTETARAMRFCCLLTVLLSFPICGLCEDPLLCSLGQPIVEVMDLQWNGHGTIDPAVLVSSAAFLETCPAAVMPAFESLSSKKGSLRQGWIAALKSSKDVETNGDLNAFLGAARRNVRAENSPALNEFADGIFSRSGVSTEAVPAELDKQFERQTGRMLQLFTHCDAAECFNVSDFLLFLLGTRPTAFWSAMHADPKDAAKWLSQMPDMSFAGESSEGLQRERSRKFLLQRVLTQAKPGMGRERNQCIRTLRKVSYRAWD